MEYYFHSAAWLQAALLILALYFQGYWVTALAFPAWRERAWAVMPIAGALVQALALALLNYLGTPVRSGVGLVLFACLVLNGWAWWKTSFPILRAEWELLALAGGATALFLLPYVLYSGYPFLGDSFMYDCISDFIREHGYFASAEPAAQYPWLGMMGYAQRVHLAMGANYTQAAAGALLGVSSPRIFMPVTAAFLYLSLCGLRLLLDKQGAAVGMLLYGTNVPLVWIPASINLLRQVGGTGFLFALIALALGEPTMWQLGLMLAGVVTFYPEFLPFVLLPLAMYYVLRREWSAVRMWAGAFAFALVLHPYGWFAAVQNVLFHWKAKPGFVVSASALDYVAYVGGWEKFVPAGIVVLAVAVWGWTLLEVRRRTYVLLAASVFAAVGASLWFGSHYTYGVYKNVLFAYYLIVMGVAAALALPGYRQATAMLAVSAAMFVPVRDFVRSDYGIETDGAYQEIRGQRRMLELFEPLSSKPTQGQTLLAIADDRLSKWVAYFYRGPVSLLFGGEYLPAAKDSLPRPGDHEFSQMLLLRADTSVVDEDLLRWKNSLLAISAPQLMVTRGETGWLDRKVGLDGASYTMERRANLLVYSPDPRSLRLTGASAAACAMRINGQPADAIQYGFWRSPSIPVEAGVTTLWLESDCPRIVWQGAVSLVKPVRGEVDMSDVGARQGLVGLTADGWMLGNGIRLIAPTAKHLRLEGQSLNMPQALQVSVGKCCSEGQQRVELTEKTFGVTVDLKDEEVQIRPERTWAGINGDPRPLAIRLTRVLAY